MKTIPKSLFLAVLAIIFSSCSASRYVSDDAALHSINELALISPYADISFLDKNEHLAPDDSLSEICEGLLTRAMFESGLPISELIELEDGLFYDSCREEIAGFRDFNPAGKGVIPIPPSLDFLLQSQGKRYGVMVYATGFERDIKGYRTAMALGVLTSVVTAVASMGMVTTYNYPEKFLLETRIAVLDSEDDCIIYFDRTGGEASPVREKHVRIETRKIVKHFLK